MERAEARIGAPVRVPIENGENSSVASSPGREDDADEGIKEDLRSVGIGVTASPEANVKDVARTTDFIDILKRPLLTIFLVTKRVALDLEESGSIPRLCPIGIDDDLDPVVRLIVVHISSGLAEHVAGIGTRGNADGYGSETVYTVLEQRFIPMLNGGFPSACLLPAEENSIPASSLVSRLVTVPFAIFALFTEPSPRSSLPTSPSPMSTLLTVPSWILSPLTAPSAILDSSTAPSAILAFSTASSASLSLSTAPSLRSLPLILPSLICLLLTQSLQSSLSAVCAAAGPV